MTGSATTSAFRGSAGDEVVRALQHEQEPFVHGTSEFAPNFAAVGIESALNRAVRIIFVLRAGGSCLGFLLYIIRF